MEEINSKKINPPLPELGAEQIKRSARRRTFGIRLYPDRHWEMMVPAAATDEEIRKAFQQFAPWLQKKLAQLTTEEPVHNFKFAPGETFFFLGTPMILHWQPGTSSQIITCHGDELHTPSDDPEKIKLMLENFYRRQIRQLVNSKLTQYTRQFQIKIGRVTITGAKARFGSCSSRGDLCFSWRMAMYPESLIELVILHELAHRREMNHSREFYRVLAGYLPDHRERNRQLNEWTKKLSAYPN